MEEKNSALTEPTPSIQSITTQSIEKRRSKKKFGFITLGITICLILIGFGTYYYLNTQQNNSIAIDKSKGLEMTAYTSPTLKPTYSSSLPKEYKSRYFDITENFWSENEKYPTELTQIPENSLTPIYCSPMYVKNGKKYTSNSFILDDPTLLEYIKALDQKYESEERTVIYITTCSPKEGKAIVLYSLGPCGGGCTGIPHVGIANGSEIKEIANISKLEDKNAAFFGCAQPLQLTKNNIFYFECGGGDGHAASASLYKLSLTNETVSRIRSCSNIVAEDENPKKECK